jgi:ABC-type phosphate transport system substrate-binding protein
MRFLLLLSTIAALAQDGPPPPPAFRLIVHPNSPVTSLDRRFVEDAFLKKVKTWPTGEVIRPVDLEPESPTRRRFTEEVLRRPLAAVRAYWQQRIFSGRDVPPPELDSDQQVIDYVMKYPGAIGYVSGAADLKAARQVQIR